MKWPTGIKRNDLKISQEMSIGIPEHITMETLNELPKIFLQKHILGLFRLLVWYFLWIIWYNNLKVYFWRNSQKKLWANLKGIIEEIHKAFVKGIFKKVAEEIPKGNARQILKILLKNFLNVLQKAFGKKWPNRIEMKVLSSS